VFVFGRPFNVKSHFQNRIINFAASSSQRQDERMGVIGMLLFSKFSLPLSIANRQQQQQAKK
jgi:hypothetical protein